MSDWKISGEKDGAVPEVGATYAVRHSRKGEFVVRVTRVNGEWLTGVILRGVAKAVMRYNVAAEGDEVTVRDSLSYLVRLGAGPAK